MSVVVAVYDEINDRYVLGADTQVSAGDLKYSLPANESKIWEYNVGGNFPKIIVGGAGMLRAMQVVQYTTLFCADDFLEYPDGFDCKWMCNEFVPRLLGALGLVGLLIDKRDEETGMTVKAMPCSFIIAYNNKCFTVSPDCVIKEIEDYGAIGSGNVVAYGGLYQSKGENPFKRVKEAAGEHTIYVNKEVDFFTTEDIKGEEEFLIKEDYEGLEKFWEETKIRQEANYLDLIHYREFKQLVKSKVSDELWEDIQTEFAKIIAGDEEDGVSSSND